MTIESMTAKEKVVLLTRGAAGSARCAKDCGTPDHLQEKRAQEHHGHVARGHHGVVRTDGLTDRGILLSWEP